MVGSAADLVAAVANPAVQTITLVAGVTLQAPLVIAGLRSLTLQVRRFPQNPGASAYAACLTL